jgi:hypothetical protein
MKVLGFLAPVIAGVTAGLGPSSSDSLSTASKDSKKEYPSVVTVTTASPGSVNSSDAETVVPNEDSFSLENFSLDPNERDQVTLYRSQLKTRLDELCNSTPVVAHVPPVRIPMLPDAIPHRVSVRRFSPSDEEEIRRQLLRLSTATVSMQLLKRGNRLSVMPVSGAHAEVILALEIKG